MSEQPPEQNELRASLQKNAKRKRGIIIGIIAAVAVIAIGIVLVLTLGGRGNAPEAEGDAAPLKVRIALAEDENWHDTLAEVAEEKGVEIEFVNTDDWVLPNTELLAGSVDANAFQHIVYLSAFNAENDADLAPAFSTIILPWGVFSAQYDSLDAIPDGGDIVIPDDPSNGARALYLLQAAGLISIDESVEAFPTVDDITDNPKNLTFTEVAGLTIPQHYDDPAVAAVVAGAGYFDPAQGISNEDALFNDDRTPSRASPTSTSSRSTPQTSTTRRGRC